MNNQNTETPWPFFKAVEKYFGIEFSCDMAASNGNAKAKIFFGEHENSLEMEWFRGSWCWLNPPFRNLTKWIDKCHEESQNGSKIVSIWPLSSDRNQIKTWQNAEVTVIHGRVWPYVRGCMLCRWGMKYPFVAGAEWNGKELKRIW